jgi:predicted RNA binding protein YcfA (HicA-like mRNA interferase family)
MNGNEVIRRMKAEGWRQVRVRGSHHLMEKDGRVVPVPVHGSKEMGKGLLAEIERQTGVKFK